MKRRLLTLLLLLMPIALFSCCYRLRATILLPMSDTVRAKWMNGYSGLDCTSFVTVVHGLRHVPEFHEWYSEANPQHFTVVATYATRYDIDESKLQPGDIAAFVGHPHVEDLGYEVIDGVRLHKEFVHYGSHVAIFLNAGRWTDSDTRRGGIAQYDLRTKPADDDWFSGNVRILRWKD